MKSLARANYFVKNISIGVIKVWNVFALSKMKAGWMMQKTIIIKSKLDLCPILDFAICMGICFGVKGSFKNPFPVYLSILPLVTNNALLGFFNIGWLFTAGDTNYIFVSIPFWKKEGGFGSSLFFKPKDRHFDFLTNGLIFALGQIQAIFGVPVAFSSRSANLGEGIFFPERILEM